MTFQGRWFVWQVLIPVLAPIALSAVFIGLWSSGAGSFVPNWRIILDLSPWALNYFSLTLIGATLNELWPKIGIRPALAVGLFLLAAAVAVYSAFLVIWRHDQAWQPGQKVYYVTLILCLASVYLSHQGYARAKE